MQNILFIDRDGTLIDEPKSDFQVDTLEKLLFEPKVIPALLELQNAGYRFVIVSNQDGLGTESNPQDKFDLVHERMMETFASQGIIFDEVLLCPHFPEDQCECRKPKTGMVTRYLEEKLFNPENSYVIGDRETDLGLAENMGIEGILYDREKMDWSLIVERLIDKGIVREGHQARSAKISRKTKETDIEIELFLDETGSSTIETGIPFFNHMLDQIATHGGFRMNVAVDGDLEIDDHHTVEHTGLA